MAIQVEQDEVINQRTSYTLIKAYRRWQNIIKLQGGEIGTLNTFESLLCRAIRDCLQISSAAERYDLSVAFWSGKKLPNMS